MNNIREGMERQKAWERIAENSAIRKEQMLQETDPYGKSANTPGAKLDSGKAPIWQGFFDYFPHACEAVSMVSAQGAAKYAWKGWQFVPDGISRYRNAQGRHILNESIEGPFDSEGFRHLAQNVWNGMAALELVLREEILKKDLSATK